MGVPRAAACSAHRTVAPGWPGCSWVTCWRACSADVAVDSSLSIDREEEEEPGAARGGCLPGAVSVPTRPGRELQAHEHKLS